MLSDDDLEGIDPTDGDESDLKNHCDSIVRDEKGIIRQSKGKPPTLTPSIYVRLRESFKSPTTISNYAESAGLSRRTLSRWLNSGRRLVSEGHTVPTPLAIKNWIEGGKTVSKEDRLVSLFFEFKAGKRTIINEAVDAIKKAMTGTDERPPDGKLALQVLERLDNQTWGLKAKEDDKPKGEDGTTIEYIKRRIILPEEKPLPEE